MATPTSTAMTRPAAVPSAKTSQDSKYNTSQLPARILADIAAASCAAVSITPIITLIDRSIMETASSVHPTIMSSLRSSIRSIAANPFNTLLSRPFALVFMLYGGTYLTANTLDTASSTLSNKPASSITSGAAKFAASSAANVSLCVYKDQAFVKLFGPTTAAAPRPVPLPCYAIFAMRDALTIFASFNVPPLLAPYIDASSLKLPVSGVTAAQFAAPASVQLISTPLHLLGLDLYNRPGLSFGERWQMVKSNWAVCAAARIGRIIPAFGVGGVVNMKVRKTLMTKLE